MSVIAQAHSPTLPQCPFGKETIEALIPHRSPFIFVHRVLSYDIDGGLLTAEYVLHPDAYFLQGHFPGKPIMPGVLVVEGMAQTACILGSMIVQSKRLAPVKYVPYLVAINKAKFNSIIVPADTLTYQAHLLRKKMKLMKCRVDVHVGSTVAATAEISSYEDS